MKQISIIFITIFTIAISTIAQGQCFNWQMQNNVDCDLDVEITITCGSNTYIYSGIVPADISGTYYNVGFDPVASSGTPTNCDFSGCLVQIMINGQIVTGAGGQICCDGCDCTTLNCCMMINMDPATATINSHKHNCP